MGSLLQHIVHPFRGGVCVCVELVDEVDAVALEAHGLHADPIAVGVASDYSPKEVSMADFRPC